MKLDCKALQVRRKLAKVKVDFRGLQVKRKLSLERIMKLDS